ncbi:MAG: glycosyltransferase family 39 protein [Candidatus Accumulibacter sp.]|nr:glycosyltransferase family 39 protein [Accumulibacter sp.]
MEKYIRLPKDPVKLLLALCLAVFLLLTLRNTGLYPAVFHDEYTYSTSARLLPFSESPIPGYLYLWIYSFTNYCGDGFLDCARIFNALFFVSGAVFVFLLARKVMSDLMAVLIAAFSILGPFSIYTAYFMPESMYFFAFWLFAWKLTGLDADSRRREWILAGFVFGCVSLVKPHSLLFAPAVVVYIAYLVCEKCGKRIVAFTEKAGSFFITAAIVKFLIGFLFAGKSAFTIFGSFYGEYAVTATRDQDLYFKLFDFTAQVSIGQAMGMAVLYGVPFFIAIQIVYGLLKNGNADRSPLNKITVFTILVVLNLVFVTTVFSALEIVNTSLKTGRIEELMVLHMRYYSFALPLFFIVAAGGGVFAKPTAKPNLFLYLVLALLTGIACYAVYVEMYPFITSGYLHSPDLAGVRYDDTVFLVFGVFAIFSMGLCFWRVDIGARLYLSLAVPYFLVSSFNMIVITRSWIAGSSIGDRAGIFAKNYLSLDDRNKLVVAGDPPMFLFRAAFHIDAPKSLMCFGDQCIGPGSAFHLETPEAYKSLISRDQSLNFTVLPPGKEWILFIGKRVPDGNFSKILPLNGFTLARVSDSYLIDLSKPEWPGIVNQMGLTYIENRGARNVAGKIEIDFAAPLPARFDLTLLARSHGIPSGKAFVARVGDAAASFGLKGDSDERIVLRFDNPTRSSVLSVEIPASVRESNEAGRDAAVPGLELMKMEIKPII